MRIVKACRARDLTPLHKQVFEEHYGLQHDGRGAIISAFDIGRRLGWSRATIERVRADLQRWGLLVRRDLGDGRADEWFAVLPINHSQVRQKINDDDLDRYAELLERHINSLNGDGGRRPATNDENEPPSSP